LRISDSGIVGQQKAPRWDNFFLNNNIPKITKKIWVCGPPLMEENFDKDLESICKQKGINFVSQTDLM